MVQFIVYLDEEMDNRLKEMKNVLKISKADIIQNIIKDYLKNKPVEQTPVKSSA